MTEMREPPADLSWITFERIGKLPHPPRLINEPVCPTCAHAHTSDLTLPTACGCADHVWTDACPYVGTACPPAAERADILAALERDASPWLSHYALPRRRWWQRLWRKR